MRSLSRWEFFFFANLDPTEAKCLLKILHISEGSMVTVFPTLEFLIELMGLAFLDFCSSMLCIPSQVFFHVSQVSTEKLKVILLFTYAR